MNDPQIIDGVFKTADRLGSLPTATILALLCISMGYYIYKKMKLDKADSENWRLTREEAVRAEEHQTEALNKLVDVTAMNASEIKEMRIILNERLPYRGKYGDA